jgi:hypothetical protein
MIMRSNPQRLLPVAVIAVLAFSSATTSVGQDKAKETVLLKRVPIINDVKYELQTSEPPNLVVTAEGTVPTGGWTEVQLIRRVYEKEPAGGIWEYDLLAKPPEGPAIQVLSKVKASDTWEKVDAKKLKGLRVYGLEKGIKTIMFK